MVSLLLLVVVVVVVVVLNTTLTNLLFPLSPCSPRQYLEKLQGKIPEETHAELTRARNACANGQEHFPLFVAAVVSLSPEFIIAVISLLLSCYLFIEAVVFM